MISIIRNCDLHMLPDYNPVCVCYYWWPWRWYWCLYPSSYPCSLVSYWVSYHPKVSSSPIHHGTHCCCFCCWNMLKIARYVCYIFLSPRTTLSDINALGNYILLFSLGFGATSCAVATSLSKGVMFALIFLYLSSREGYLMLVSVFTQSSSLYRTNDAIVCMCWCV